MAVMPKTQERFPACLRREIERNQTLADCIRSADAKFGIPASLSRKRMRLRSAYGLWPPGMVVMPETQEQFSACLRREIQRNLPLADCKRFRAAHELLRARASSAHRATPPSAPASGVRQYAISHWLIANALPHPPPNAWTISMLSPSVKRSTAWRLRGTMAWLRSTATRRSA